MATKTKPATNTKARKDGNKHNNLPCNLEWVTRSNNIYHSLRSGLHTKEETPVVAYHNNSGYWFSSQANVKAFGFTQSNVNKVLRGVRPKHKGYSWEYAAHA